MGPPPRTSAEVEYEEEFASEQIGEWAKEDLDEMDELAPVSSELVQVDVVPVPPAPELHYTELATVPKEPEEIEPIGTPVPPPEAIMECIVCFDQKVAKENLLACGHPICVDCLSLLRRPICPADQKTLAGPLLQKK